MQDPKDEGTQDWVEQAASALKSETGELQLPTKPENLLKAIALHCLSIDRSPDELVEDIRDATCFWIQDRDIQKQMNNITSYYAKGKH